MGKSLFEFSKDKKGMRAEPQPQCKQQGYENRQKVGNMSEEDVKKKVNEYSKLSENELMRELYNEIGKQKAGGNFDVEKLKSQFENIKPMLNSKQNDNLERILKNLK